ncbi:hypothetical protein F1880_009775 [Penicillium rolfsii]|nr:hypothetical protein F1880_009775 [Penicillium rolfsii]
MLLDSRGFARVVLGETVSSSSLCAHKIVVFIGFGIFAGLQAGNMFTRCISSERWSTPLKVMIGRPVGINGNGQEWNQTSSAV